MYCPTQMSSALVEWKRFKQTWPFFAAKRKSKIQSNNLDLRILSKYKRVIWMKTQAFSICNAFLEDNKISIWPCEHCPLLKLLLEKIDVCYSSKKSKIWLCKKIKYFMSLSVLENSLNAYVIHEYPFCCNKYLIICAMRFYLVFVKFVAQRCGNVSNLLNDLQ